MAMQLSDEAKTLLIEAAKDRHGQILRAEGDLGGRTTEFQTNGQTFGEQGNPRSTAAWEAGLRQLESQNLIEDQGHTREVFPVTDKGYKLADALGAKS
jgi:hypothetical protein